jgi:hypothetical protein
MSTVRWAAAAAASAVLATVSACGNDQPKPQPTVAARDITDPCQFLNDDERASLQLEPAEPGPDSSTGTSASPDVRSCSFAATEGYNRNSEYIALVLVSLIGIDVEIARAALDNRGPRDPLRALPPFEKAPGKPYYQREDVHSSRSCERLLGISSGRTVAVTVIMDKSTSSSTRPCQTADHLAPLIEHKLSA